MDWNLPSPNISRRITEIAHGLSALSQSPPENPGLYTENDLLPSILVRSFLYQSCCSHHQSNIYAHISVIDAEVRYAVRHEYAQTAIDVLARRTRLSFLNARAALDALPTVVDIMAQELNWTYAQRKQQIDDAVRFLGSMGISPALAAAYTPEPIPRGRWENFTWSMRKAGVGAWNLFRAVPETRESFGPGRSKFEAGEVAALRSAFTGRARPVEDGEEKVKAEEVVDVLKLVPSYSEISKITKKELDYVLDEAGMHGQSDFNFDEFIEVGTSSVSLFPFPKNFFILTLDIYLSRFPVI